MSLSALPSGLIRLLAPTLCLGMLFLAPAWAHSYKMGALSIGHVWAQPAEKGANAAVYAPIFNQGDAKVSLVGVTTEAAEKAVLVTAESGKSEELDHIDFPPGKPLALAPWRQHIEVVGLKKAYASGDSFDIELDFGAAGKITVRVEVSEEGGH